MAKQIDPRRAVQGNILNDWQNSPLKNCDLCFSAVVRDKVVDFWSTLRTCWEIQDNTTWCENGADTIIRQTNPESVGPSQPADLTVQTEITLAGCCDGSQSKSSCSQNEADGEEKGQRQNQSQDKTRHPGYTPNHGLPRTASVGKWVSLYDITLISVDELVKIFNHHRVGQTKSPKQFIFPKSYVLEIPCSQDKLTMYNFLNQYGTIANACPEHVLWIFEKSSFELKRSRKFFQTLIQPQKFSEKLKCTKMPDRQVTH